MFAGTVLELRTVKSRNVDTHRPIATVLVIAPLRQLLNLGLPQPQQLGDLPPTPTKGCPCSPNGRIRKTARFQSRK